MSIMITSSVQSLMFLPMCLGMYLTYRVMDITDLTVEATFILGAAIYAKLIFLHDSSILAVILAIFMTALVGFLVAAMQRIAKIDSLIASILAIFMLYSVNFKVMGRPNISLLSDPVVLSQLQYQHPLILLMILFI